MSRLPIRLRVTLAFAGVMAVLLAGLGAFVYLRYQTQVRDAVDQGLRNRAAEVTNLILTGADRGDGPASRKQGASTKGFFERDEGFAAILTTGGKLIQGSSSLTNGFMLNPSDLQRATQETLITDRGVKGIHGDVRVLATPVEVGNNRRIIVVASSLDDSKSAARNLLRLLLIGGPVALLVASLAGYLAIAAALRPVESMRRRAREISDDSTNERRLPLAAADDELRRLGETLNEMLDRLEGAIERERAFVDDASHELRTPLALHKTELELALRYATSAEEMRAALASSAVEVDRLIGLAEDMLVIARSDHDTPHAEPFPVAGLLGDMTERFSARAAEANRELTIGGLTEAKVAADRVQAERALSNLIDNALRHGGGSIVLSARESGEFVELHVVDEGSGFPPGFVERAFERFTRGDAARPRGGSGLGLAIARQIATGNDGEAGARNLDPSGADVWIALPKAG